MILFRLIFPILTLSLGSDRGQSGATSRPGVHRVFPLQTKEQPDRCCGEPTEQSHSQQRRKGQDPPPSPFYLCANERVFSVRVCLFTVCFPVRTCTKLACKEHRALTVISLSLSTVVSVSDPEERRDGGEVQRHRGAQT